MNAENKIEQILKIIESNHDKEYIRRLLSELNPCRKCLENSSCDGDKEENCPYRQRFQMEIKNYYHDITYKNKKNL